MGIDKIKIFQIGLFETDLSLLSTKIRNRHDYVDSVLEAAKFFITKYNGPYVKQSRHQGILTYYKCQKGANRIIISHGIGNEHKIVSFHFPFDIIEKNDRIFLCIKNASVSSDNLRKVSEISSYMRNMESGCNGEVIPSFISTVQKDLGNDESDPLLDIDLELYCYISSCEPGYLRYDHDDKAKNGQIHPEYHFDVNYHVRTSYKYGLYKKITLEEFEKIFIKNSVKMYLHTYNINNEIISFKTRIKQSKRKSRK